MFKRFKKNRGSKRDSRRSSAYDRYYQASKSKREGIFQQFTNLPTETKSTILSIVFIVFGVLIFLSSLGVAGIAGKYINIYTYLIFGKGAWILPFVLIFLAYFLISSKYEVKGLNYLGTCFLVFSFSAIIHLVKYSDQLFAAAKSGLGGGIVGFAISYPLQKFLGFWASLVIFVALFMIGFLLFLNTSFSQIFSSGTAIKSLWQQINNFFIKLRVKKIQKARERGTFSETPAEEAMPEFKEKDVPVLLEIEETTKKEPGRESETEEEQTSKQLNSGVKKWRTKKIDLPLNLLNGKAGEPTSGDIKANQYIIAKTLQNFGILVEMGEVNIGPTVTQYTLKPAEGVKLSRIVSLNDNLALALAAHPIRIEAPIPGRSLVGIEVPNQSKAVVPLREVLKSAEFSSRKSNLMIALGKDVKGQPWLVDLGKMPHLLIAGATNSGKSVCVHAIILSLLFQNNPGELKFIMVDPKRVELPVYNGIPHLLTPVITDVKKTVNALRWAIAEMEQRFEILSNSHKRDIYSYNSSMSEKIPYIIVVIDELADLMAAAGAAVEGVIIRLAQMSRAVGIHLILATQRPSVDVLTGLIKANMPARIAFSVASLVDSRTILDMSGAEKLLGKGDMLHISADISKPKRLQGAYATEAEIKRVVDYLKEQAEPEYMKEVIEGSKEIEKTFEFSEQDKDPLLEEAKAVIMQAGKASASLLQRRLRIGYARAARLLDLLEEKGIIGPGDGAKPREILIKEGYGDNIMEEQQNEVDEEEDEDNRLD